jgi:hypothetical protein
LRAPDLAARNDAPDDEGEAVNGPNICTLCVGTGRVPVYQPRCPGDFRDPPLPYHVREYEPCRACAGTGKLVPPRPNPEP